MEIFGALAQLVERFAGSEEVRGSTPLGSTIQTPRFYLQNPLAELSIKAFTCVRAFFALTIITTRCLALQRRLGQGASYDKHA